LRPAKNPVSVLFVVTGSGVVEAPQPSVEQPAATSWHWQGQRLARLLAAREDLDRKIADAVHEARDGGMTWPLIAEHLRISSAIAQRLWGPYPRPLWHKLPGRRPPDFPDGL
jgi:hypothetical protein